MTKRKLKSIKLTLRVTFVAVNIYQTNMVGVGVKWKVVSVKRVGQNKEGGETDG